MSLLGRLPQSVDTSSEYYSKTGLTQLDRTIHWLVARQTAVLDEEDEFDTNADETDTPATCHDTHSFVKMRSYPSKTGEMSYQDRPTSHFELQWAGFNGRLNKIADSCYTWWTMGTLSVSTTCRILLRVSVREELLIPTLIVG